jgi:hypothetical protein
MVALPGTPQIRVKESEVTSSTDVILHIEYPVVAATLHSVTVKEFSYLVIISQACEVYPHL